jgi:hypothetical protein
MRVVASATTRGPAVPTARTRRRLTLVPARNLRAKAGVSPVAAAAAPGQTASQR